MAALIAISWLFIVCAAIVKLWAPNHAISDIYRIMPSAGLVVF